MARVAQREAPRPSTTGPPAPVDRAALAAQRDTSPLLSSLLLLLMALQSPAPRLTAPLLSREDVLASLESPELLLVDVRRTDYEGGAIRGSLNVPEQSFYMNRAALYGLVKRAGVSRVGFYCGSSNGRGPRCAGWFADYLAEKGDQSIESVTLAGGIKGWVKAGKDYVEKVDGYQEDYWKQFSESK